jgi:hypothetical protein
MDKHVRNKDDELWMLVVIYRLAPPPFMGLAIVTRATCSLFSFTWEWAVVKGNMTSVR